MKYLVTAATGNLGSKVVNSLLKLVPASDIAVTVRSLEKATALKEKGVDIRIGDYEQPESLEKAFNGVERLLLISSAGDDDTRIRQHLNAVAAAKKAGVAFIAYTSIANATNSKNLLAPAHRATEKAIKESGIPYSFLRNNWYLENEQSSIDAVVAGSDWVTSAENGKVGWAIQQDYADAAAIVLANNKQDNTVYELSNTPITQKELVALLEEILGKKITIKNVSDEEYAANLRTAGLPEEVISMIIGIQVGIRENTLNVSSADFEKVLGRPTTPLKTALESLIKK